MPKVCPAVRLIRAIMLCPRGIFKTLPLPFVCLTTRQMSQKAPDHEKWNSSPRCKGGRCEEDTFNNVWSGKAIQSTKQTGVNWTCDNLLIGFNLAARHANILKDEIAVVMSAFE